MITLYFDCFFGVSGEKIIGALIDCLGLYDLAEVLEKVSGYGTTLRYTKTLAGGIPGTRVEIISDEARMRTENINEDPSYREVLSLTREMFLMTGGRTRKDFYTLFCVLYLLSKTEYDRVITSPVYDGVGDGTEGNMPDMNVISFLENCGIKMIITDSAQFVSTMWGASVLSVITDDCGMMPEGDIIKIGYGLGQESDGVSDALRLVIVSQRQREAADMFEAALKFSSNCVVSGTYSNKGKID